MGWESLQWTDVKYLHHGTTYRAWRSIIKTEIIPGYIEPSHRDRMQQGTQRSEAFYSSSTFWLGAQGAIMTEGVVPAAAVLAVRRIKGYREAGK
eukprot:8485117-Pyramimonas_sp.AAC.1